MRKALTSSELGFTSRDVKQLQQALVAVHQARTFRRIQTVLLVAKGATFAEAASLTGVSRRSAYHIVTQYLQLHSVAVLHDQPRSGRPRVGTQATDARILSELEQLPLALGYRTNVWTVELLAEHLGKQHQCSISARTLRRRMKQMGLRCKRPRYVYSEKEAHRAQKKGRLSGV